jgi:lipoprotein-anchoring transpeptidase ErfK/SrfK
VRNDHVQRVWARPVAALTAGLVLSAVASGCGSSSAPNSAAPTSTASTPRAPVVRHCSDGTLRALGSARRAYVGSAPAGAAALRRPGGAVIARFGATNINHFPTMFGVVGVIVGRDCRPRWYRVQLPVKPNGTTGYVRASELALQTVATRILVDLSERRLTMYQSGKATLTATVAIGGAATPTPTGRYYVNQRLVPADTSGPYGPGAVGISAFSNVLTGWTQGGPVAIHGTDAPWSIGRAVSNGCVRLPNATLLKVFAAAGAGTPVIIKE